MLSTFNNNHTFRGFILEARMPLTSAPEKKKKKDKHLEAATKKFLKFCSYAGIGMSSLIGGYDGVKAGMNPAGRLVMAYVNGMGGGDPQEHPSGRTRLLAQEHTLCMVVAWLGSCRGAALGSHKETHWD